MSKPLLVIVSGPSGVGKTTISRALRDAFDDADLSVSCTTRPKAPTDTDGVDYHFITEEEFEKRVSDPAGPQGLGQFLEHAGVYGKRYGTLRKPVDDALAQGRLVILEIDVQGALQVKQRAPSALAILILPPSEQSLLARLRGRGRDSEEVIQKRFAAAKRDIEAANESGVYDVTIVNRDLDQATAEAVAAVRNARNWPRSPSDGA
ncbi:MAG: guanylate kinase [Phycisphaerales bacterium]